MDDLTAFEREIGDELRREIGPLPGFDAMSIVRSVTATRSPKWRFQSMFSATRFVVAGAIVALFGGFLLAGGLTQPSDDMAPAAVTASPSPTTTEEPLSGMVTEEVEPGVYRVLDDGAGHDLAADPPGGVTVAPDGSVWLLRTEDARRSYGWQARVGTLLELGVEGSQHLADVLGYQVYTFSTELAVDADGVAWIESEGDLLSFDGTALALETRPRRIDGLARSLPEGVARLVDGEWAILEGDRYEGTGHLTASGAGTTWSAPGAIEPGQAIYRHDEDGWAAMELPATLLTQAGSSQFQVRAMAAGEGGTFWADLDIVRDDDDGFEPYLVRYADGHWTGFGKDEGVPILDWHTYTSRIAVDGDGRVWIAPGNGDGWPADLNDELGAADGPVGVLAFDGQRWSRFLDGVQINRVAIADDGTVYATGLNGCTEGEYFGPEGYGCPLSAVDPSVGGLYVITPEAVAASE
jgi:hypothetical protein